MLLLQNFTVVWIRHARVTQLLALVTSLHFRSSCDSLCNYFTEKGDSLSLSLFPSPFLIPSLSLSQVCVF